MEFTDLSVSLEWQELNTYIEDKSNLVRDTELRHINTILDPQDSLLPTNGVITYIKNWITDELPLKKINFSTIGDWKT